MNKSLSILVIVALTLLLVDSKPIYDFKTSYITQLTYINFKDQVSKIRQNTNYVSIVHYYKYSGNLLFIKDGSSLNLAKDFDTWTT
jgi:hypothetical protein